MIEIVWLQLLINLMARISTLSLVPFLSVPWSCCSLQILAKMKGRDLAGRTYQPLFPYFLRLKQADGAMKGAFRVLTDEYVTADAGTGVVHQAPAFGEDDYRVCRHHGEPWPAA